MDFLANRFDVQVDVGATIDHLQRTTTQLASGLATWVPNISHDSGVFDTLAQHFVQVSSELTRAQLRVDVVMSEQAASFFISA
jgi:hypothetical protein